jgi:hypothetical protein
MWFRARGTSCRQGRFGTQQHDGDLGVVIAEHVVQDERDALCRAQRFEDHEEGHGHRLGELDRVGRVPVGGQRFG